ncbi:MAG: cation:proton antiporter domain-containing protein, partial [Candidatus Latescibacterota bacterium]
MFNAHEVAILLFDIGILLGLARFLGEVARRYRQPMVAGEILAGIILGPTVLGSFAPLVEEALFPLSGDVLVAMEGLTIIASALLLLVAGAEISLSSFWRQGKTAALTSTFGIIIPLCLGFGAAWFFPGLFSRSESVDAFIFSLFFGTALSISALPIIAKTLIDMNLLKSDFGVLIMASAALNDLIGWLIFSVVIGMMGAGRDFGRGVGETILLTMLFAVFMLTAVRWAFNRILPWLERKTVWPGGVLASVFAFTMLGAAASDWLGSHAVFGAFLVGIAVGDSRHLTERTKDTVTQFATNIFAPLFFAYIGLRINFAANFVLPLVAAVFLLACAGKVLGCFFGARLGGMRSREALAVGFGMNSRGTMEIILGLLALEYGLIGENLFVALVVMAIGTAMLSGPVIEFLVQEKRPLRLSSLLKPSGFKSECLSATRREVIMELSALAAREAGLDTMQIFRAAWEREQLIGTALGGGIAVPHARLIEIKQPVVVAGHSVRGIDFNALDGAPVHITFLILTPAGDQRMQLQILSDIARIFTDSTARLAALHARDFTSFFNAIC